MLQTRKRQSKLHTSSKPSWNSPRWLKHLCIYFFLSISIIFRRLHAERTNSIVKVFRLCSAYYCEAHTWPSVTEGRTNFFYNIGLRVCSMQYYWCYSYFSFRCSTFSLTL